MNKIRCHVVVLALSVLVAQSAVADDNLWVGAKAGTLGLGVEGTWRPLPFFDLRAGLNLYDYAIGSGSEAGINYDTSLNLDTVYATANFRVPLNPFRFTVGMYSNSNELSMVSRGATGTVGGVTYLPSEVGTLRSTVSFKSTAPYLGFGFDFRAFNRIGINLDFGFLWQDSPIVTLTSNGTLAGDPLFDSALDTERLELETELEDFKAYPVFSIGFAFNF